MRLYCGESFVQTAPPTEVRQRGTVSDTICGSATLLHTACSFNCCGSLARLDARVVVVEIPRSQCSTNDFEDEKKRKSASLRHHWADNHIFLDRHSSILNDSGRYFGFVPSQVGTEQATLPEAAYIEQYCSVLA